MDNTTLKEFNILAIKQLDLWLGWVFITALLPIKHHRGCSFAYYSTQDLI